MHCCSCSLLPPRLRRGLDDTFHRLHRTRFPLAVLVLPNEVLLVELLKQLSRRLVVHQLRLRNGKLVFELRDLLPLVRCLLLLLLLFKLEGLHLGFGAPSLSACLEHRDSLSVGS